jgi:phospholipid/cholesterol/gamma-HCH transport system substrate-binding protein
MQNKTTDRIKLGIFITLAIGLLIMAVYIVGRKQNMFKPTIKISTVFKSVKGLKLGNNVRYSGIDIGTVVNMNILTDTSVYVELSIEKSVVPFIKKNSIATIGTEGLMGSKIVLILPGTPDKPHVVTGDNILSIEPVEIDDIMIEIKGSSEKISRVSDNLIEITDKINRGEGILGELFTDEDLTRNIDRAGENAVTITESLIDISDKVNKGYGILGKMLTDTVFTEEMETAGKNLNVISANIKEISDKINRGEGVFGRLFADTSITHNLYNTSINLESATRNLSEIIEKMNTRKSVFNKLISDSTFADSLELTIQRLNKGIIEATEASEAIQKSGLIRIFSKEEDKENKEEEY